MRTILLFLVQLGFWLLLSGKYDKAQLWIAAIIACTITTWLCHRMRIVDEEGQPTKGILGWFSFLAWLMAQIVKSNFQVARVVWSPRLPIDPVLVELPHDLRTTLGQVTYANSITLTPGTVTVKIDRRRVMVHALTKEAADDVASGAMLGRIRKREVEPR